MPAKKDDPNALVQCVSLKGFGRGESYVPPFTDIAIEAARVKHMTAMRYVMLKAEASGSEDFKRAQADYRLHQERAKKAIAQAKKDGRIVER